jgi:hypothetical protein
VVVREDSQGDGIIEGKGEKVAPELAVKEHAERPVNGPAKCSYGPTVWLAKVNVPKLIPRGCLAQ